MISLLLNMQKCKTIQNYKYIFATDSGLMIEATYNGDKDELYVDMYRKEHKEIVKDFVYESMSIRNEWKNER